MRSRRGKPEEGEELIDFDPKKPISPSKRRQPRDFSHLPKRVQAERNAKRPPPRTSWDHRVFQIKGLDRFRLAQVLGTDTESPREDFCGSSTQSSSHVNGASQSYVDHDHEDLDDDHLMYERDIESDGQGLDVNSSRSTNYSVRNESPSKYRSQQSARPSEASVDGSHNGRAHGTQSPESDHAATQDTADCNHGSDAPGKSQTVKDEEAAPEIIDEELTEDAFPPAYLPDLEEGNPVDEIDLDEEVISLLKTRFKRLPDPDMFIRELTRHPAKNRSSDVLYSLAENAQAALVAWQDEFLKLDAFIARNTNPPRKRATGGRQHLSAEVAEAMKEADIYGYRYDARRGPGMQVPELQRFTDDEDHVEGRSLRRRKAQLNEYAISEDDAANTETGKRKRRAVNRYDAMPEEGSRKRMRQTPDADHRGRRRGRPKQPPLPPRVQAMRAMREQSTASTSATNSDDEDRGSTPEKPTKRRGRPPGSKNLHPRSDAGIKKGPRKKLPSLPEAASENAPSKDAPAPTSAPKADTKPDGAPKTKVKSESRSESMTLWWKKRKAEQAAAQEERKRLEAERKTPHSRSNSSTLPLAPAPPQQSPAAAYPPSAKPATSAPMRIIDLNMPSSQAPPPPQPPAPWTNDMHHPQSRPQPHHFPPPPVGAPSSPHRHHLPPPHHPPYPHSASPSAPLPHPLPPPPQGHPSLLPPFDPHQQGGYRPSPRPAYPPYQIVLTGSGPYPPAPPGYQMIVQSPYGSPAPGYPAPGYPAPGYHGGPPEVREAKDEGKTG